MKESFSFNFAHFFSTKTTQMGNWALKGCSKGTPSAILGYLCVRALEGRLSTCVLKALEHSDIWALGDSRGTRRTIGHSGNQTLEAIDLADSYITRIFGEN